MARPTQVQLNAAKNQFEASPADAEPAGTEGTPSDMRADKPRVMKLAKAMVIKPKGISRVQAQLSSAQGTGTGQIRRP